MVVSAEIEPSGGPGGSPWPDLATLFAAATGGEQSAWDELVHRLEGLVWSICRLFRLSDADAADAFQLTWFRLVDKLDTIDDPRKLPGWLATTCRRECIAIYKRRNKVVSVGEDAVLDRISGPVGGADAPALIRQRNADIWQAFFKLGNDCQRVLWVLVVDPPKGSVYEKAAEQLEMPTGSLGPRRGRCLKQLKSHLAAMGITDAGESS
jgi:RNA polymerase sigma factor (sigma-70 family)